MVELKHSILGWCGAGLLKLIGLTLRWHIEQPGAGQPVWSGPYVFAFWHSDQLPMASFMTQVEAPGAPRPAAMISEHGDGRIIAAVIKFLGFPSIAGSSTRGGRRAFLEMLRRLRSGAPVAITPDGPRGPVCVAKAGVIDLAFHSGAPIYPVAVRASKAWYFGSWDRMYLPKPGARMVAIIGAPICIPQTASAQDRARQLQELETCLNELRRQAQVRLETDG